MTHRVAIVAGGSAGVGRAVVSQLISRGYRVGVFARGAQRLSDMEAEYGDKLVGISCDVADASAVKHAAEQVEARLGPVSIWVNAAMMNSFSAFSKMKSEEFERIIDTTLIGVVNGTRTAISMMQNSGHGRIINVGSGLSYRSVPYQSAYCAAKHAINGFTSALRSELIREGSNITISLVQLPALNTPQFDWALNRLPQKPQPAPPVFQPEVAARAILRAIDEGKREYFVGSSVLQLVLGNMVLPGWLDRKLADSGAEMQKSDTRDPGGRPNNLDGPVAQVDATARGSFSDRARDKALILDADHTRIVAFATLPLLALCIGLLLG